MTRPTPPAAIPPDCRDLRPLLAEFVLGFLDRQDHRLVMRHLEGCDGCTGAARAAASDLDRLGVLLAQSTESSGPTESTESSGPNETTGAPQTDAVDRMDAGRRDELWSRIERDLDVEVEAETTRLQRLVERTLPAGSTFMSGVSSPWTPSGIPGVNVKVLHLDQEQDRQTLLVQLEPGARVPAHYHHGVEEAFVLEGDLFSAGVHLNAGDYQRLEEHSDHDVQTSVAGCIAIIIGSPRDFG